MFNNLIDFVGMLVIRMRHQDGQTMAEYGILIAVIAIVVIVAAVRSSAGASPACSVRRPRRSSLA